MMVRELGLRGLQQDHFTVEAALTDNAEIDAAAYSVLSTWRRSQTTGDEAYAALSAGLHRIGWTALATELQIWADAPDEDLMVAQSSLQESQLPLSCPPTGRVETRKLPTKGLSVTPNPRRLPIERN